MREKIRHLIDKVAQQRGSAESIGFLFSILVLMFVVVNSIPFFKHVYYIGVLNQAQRHALIRMELQGGLNENIEDFILDFIEKRGLDKSCLTITGSSLDVTDIENYGKEIELKLEYQYPVRTFIFPPESLGIEAQDGIKKIIVKGYSTNLYFEKNNEGG